MQGVDQVRFGGTHHQCQSEREPPAKRYRRAQDANADPVDDTGRDVERY